MLKLVHDVPQILERGWLVFQPVRDREPQFVSFGWLSMSGTLGKPIVDGGNLASGNAAKLLTGDIRVEGEKLGKLHRETVQ